MPLMLEPSEVSEVQPPGGKWSCAAKPQDVCPDHPNSPKKSSICGHSHIIFEPTQAEGNQKGTGKI